MYKKCLFSLFLASLITLCSYTSQTEEWLLVINAQEATITEQNLVLSSQNSLVGAFTADNRQKVRTMDEKQLVDNWDTLFSSAPVNATLVFHNQQGEFSENLVVLNKPSRRGTELIFPIIELGKPISGKLGPAILFIKAPIKIANIQ